MFHPRKERIHIETVLAKHVLPALHVIFHFMRSRFELNHIRQTSELCVYTADLLHAHAKYSPYVLPVKEIAFCAHVEG